MPCTDLKPGWILLCAPWKLLFTGPDFREEGHGEVLSPAWSRHARLAVKPLQVNCQQLFQEHQALGTTLPMGMNLERQGNKASKKYSWLCHLDASFLHQHSFTWVADRDSGEQFSLLSLSKMVRIVPQLMDEVAPGSRACWPGCSQAPTRGAGDAENAPVQNKPSGGEILI